MLVVAATVGELDWVPVSVARLACGVGPVEAAAATASRLASGRPPGVLHVGIAGARRSSGLVPGDVVVGASSRYVDLVAAIPVIDVVDAPAEWVAAIAAAIPGSVVMPIVTSAAVGGSPREGAIEAMEGFGVLRACAIAGVAAVEVRVISNHVEEDDRGRWEVGLALERLAEVGPNALEALREVSPGGRGTS